MYQVVAWNLDGKIVFVALANQEAAIRLFDDHDRLGHIVTVFDQKNHGRICMAN